MPATVSVPTSSVSSAHFAPTFTDVGGVRTRFVVQGDGPPVLLLHGIGRSLEDWEGLYGRLAPDHRVISVDLPGFGLSERTTGRYSLESLARSYG